MRKLLSLCLAVVCVAYGQSASFPSNIASDTNLKVTLNGVKTALRASATAGDSILTVADCSKIVPNMLLTVGKTEIVSVNSVTTSTCNISVSRGFDGTSGTTHGSGSEVASYPTAWERNSLKSEIIAIENSLGPGLQNVLGTAASVSSLQFNFAPQTPGGTLIAGANTITMAPVPPGVSGTFTGHPLYVSGGTGGSEVCTISGGSGVAGQGSGQIIISCANSHSGAWTIQSATAGIQEAHDSLGSTGGTIRVNNTGSTIPVTGTVTLSKEGVRMVCDTPSRPLTKNGGVIVSMTAGSGEVANCGFQGNRTPGNIGIQISGIRSYVHDLRADLLDGAVIFTGGFHNFAERVWGRNLASYVVKAAGGVSPYISGITYATDAGYDVASEAGIVINTQGCYVHDVDILGARAGLRIEATTSNLTWTFVYNARFDTNYTSGVEVINNSGTYSVSGVWMDSVWMASTGMDSSTSGGVVSTDGVGLRMQGTGTIVDVRCDLCQIFNNRDQNAKIFKGNLTLRNTDFWGSNGGGTANIDNIYTETAGTVEISGGEIRSTAAGATATRAGVTAGPNSGMVYIRGVRFNTAAGPWVSTDGVFNVATTQSNVRTYSTNQGEDDVVFGLASASTLNLPVRSFFAINGTTGVDNLLPGWTGRRLMLTKLDGGTVTFSASGNIAGTFSLTTGENAVCDYVNTKWICKK
jgi:hypothetical protein